VKIMLFVSGQFFLSNLSNFICNYQANPVEGMKG